LELGAQRDVMTKVEEYRAKARECELRAGQVTHMRQGFPLQRAFAAPLRRICPAALTASSRAVFEVGEFHSYTVNFGAIIFAMEIVSGHDNTPISAGGSAGLSLPPTPGDHCR
jgi:hypothetical protein